MWKFSANGSKSGNSVLDRMIEEGLWQPGQPLSQSQQKPSTGSKLSPALQDLYVMGWDDVSDEVLQAAFRQWLVTGTRF